MAYLLPYRSQAVTSRPVGGVAKHGPSGRTGRSGGRTWAPGPPATPPLRRSAAG